MSGTNAPNCRPVRHAPGQAGRKPLPAGVIHADSGDMTQILYSTDHELRTAIIDELAWTPSVYAHEVGVSLNSGAVTLSGQVDTYPEKQEAVRAAMRVRGVTAVADEIVVRSGWAQRKDTDIAVEATETLDRMVTIPTGSVQATVHDHVITLSGAVVWDYQRTATRHAMSALRGVNAVVNMITLTPAPAASAADAKRKITAALVRNAHVEATNIHVAATGTAIELTGTVPSWAEYRQASHAVWCSPGVTEVANRLVVTA